MSLCYGYSPQSLSYVHGDRRKRLGRPAWCRKLAVDVARILEFSGCAENKKCQGEGAAYAAQAPMRICPQAIMSREELHTQYARGLQDKDGLRKRLRELSEKADELQLQLFQREAQLLAVEGRLKQQQLETLALVRHPGEPPNSLGPDLAPPLLSDGPGRSPAFLVGGVGCSVAQGLAGCSGCAEG